MAYSSNSLFSTWRRLTFSQKLSLVSLILLVLVIPLGVLITVTPRLPLFSKAQVPATPPITPPITITTTPTPSMATVSFFPSTGTYQVGETIEMSIYFNTRNIAIGGIAIRALYPFSGETPEVYVSSISLNPILVSSGDWTCPTQNSAIINGNVTVDVACANYSTDGFTTDRNTLLATVNLRVIRKPLLNPLTIHFDPARTIITRKSDNQNVLAFPASTATYTIIDSVSPTLSITPTRRPTPSFTPTPTLVPPEDNHPPRITTSQVKVGIRGRRYFAHIRAKDQDGDNITMTATNLPPGLKFANCQTSINSDGISILVCEVSGIPTRSGLFKSLFTVKDQWGLQSSRNIYFVILPSSS